MKFINHFFEFLLDILCPPVCPVCHKRVDKAHCLCSNCYASLKFITKPCCEICGRPFEYQGICHQICASCLRKKPVFDMARSILEYDKENNHLILEFKHSDRVELAPLFTKFLTLADTEIFQDVDLITPVPIHWIRLLKRKYNQAGLLAQGIAKEKNIPCQTRILKRIHHTSSQGHKSKSERERNIRHAFRVRYPNLIRGKSILLIDDVMTTGATANECAKVLKKAGAKSVKVLTLYRVLS